MRYVKLKDIRSRSSLLALLMASKELIKTHNETKDSLDDVKTDWECSCACIDPLDYSFSTMGDMMAVVMNCFETMMVGTTYDDVTNFSIHCNINNVMDEIVAAKGGHNLYDDLYICRLNAPDCKGIKAYLYSLPDYKKNIMRNVREAINAGTDEETVTAMIRDVIAFHFLGKDYIANFHSSIDNLSPDLAARVREDAKNIYEYLK